MLEERIRAAGVKVEGTFNVQRFFETLALILSAKENAKITVTVMPEEEIREDEKKREVG